MIRGIRVCRLQYQNISSINKRLAIIMVSLSSHQSPATKQYLFQKLHVASTRLWDSCPRSRINIIVINEIHEFVGLTFINNERGVLLIIMSNNLSPKSQSKLHQYSCLWRSKRNHNFLAREKIMSSCYEKELNAE